MCLELMNTMHVANKRMFYKLCSIQFESTQNRQHSDMKTQGKEKVIAIMNVLHFLLVDV